MILQRLVEHYEALHKQDKAPEFPWQMVPVALGLNLADDGTLLDIIPLLSEETRGKKKVEVPYVLKLPLRVVRSSNIKPNALADNGSYVLGLDKNNTKRCKEKFEKFRAYHEKLFMEISNHFTKSILGFLNSWDVESAAEHPKVKPFRTLINAGRNIVFMKNGVNYAQDDPEIIQSWNDFCRPSKDTLMGRCIVQGSIQPIKRIHNKIEGVPGAQSAGANLVSMEADSFRSYNIGGTGKIKTMPGVPIGEYAAFAYFTALNALINSDFKQRIHYGDTLVLYWAEEANAKAKETVNIAFNPQPSTEGELKEVFERVEKGLPVQEVELDTKFYVLGVAPNATRICITFFVESSFGNILKNIKAHYDRLEIVKPSYEKRLLLSPYFLLQETCNTKDEKEKPNKKIANDLMKAISNNTRYPYALYQSVLMRIRADQDSKEKKTWKVTYARVAIIKACLSQILAESEREVLTVSLNKESTNKAYILGRLFSVLEAAQESANPEITATIKDRFFNSACSNPAKAFPQILKLSSAHIKKSKRGYVYKKEIGDILDKLEVEEAPFPTSFKQYDQGIFILGYYQELQDRFTKKEEKEDVNN